MLHTFIGNLTEDPTFSKTDRGVTSVRLRLAVNEAYRDKKGNLQEKAPTFWDCFGWGNRADRIRDAAWKKGQAVIVVGEFTSSSWVSDDGVKHSRTTVTILNVGADATRQRRTVEAKEHVEAPAPAAPAEELPGLGTVDADAELGL
ncbi:single-stranded DNA-binding protein [Schaalia hyovaginalis]|uniref:Single-stranded DNA-binding protein n=1 Tax=Schaalia hyovaginalis TaxID=29316 RepID=A0A923E343_9ACTO|nr:single-stranded DNA-binding protein [Schaalia hyovaginalis]MBB6335141.1 single stranded DNA-binding protein [Schaalia hyovaginalis]